MQFFFFLTHIVLLLAFQNTDRQQYHCNFFFFFYKHLPCQIPWKPHESPPRCQCPSFSWPSWSKTLGSRWFHFLQIEIAITINTGLAQFCFLPSFLHHFSDVSSYLIYLGCLVELWLGDIWLDWFGHWFRKRLPQVVTFGTRTEDSVGSWRLVRNVDL